MFFDELYRNIVLFRKKIFTDESELSENKKEESKSFPSKPTSESTTKKQDTTIQPEEKKEIDPANTHPILRIRENIPSFVGTNNQNYTLYKGDIVSLPEDMAKMLLNKKVAIEIKSD